MASQEIEKLKARKIVKQCLEALPIIAKEEPELLERLYNLLQERFTPKQETTQILLELKQLRIESNRKF
jgi:hypothetical protein